jgi:hypothetical protein
LERLDPAGMVDALRAYVHGEHPVYPPDDRRFFALHRVLFAHRPDPVPFAPLLGPRFPAEEITDAVLKRDSVAMAVVTSFMRRIAEVEGEPQRQALYDLIAYAGANFSFDPLYGDSHPATGPEVADFFMIPQIGPCPESRASLRGALDESIALWRGRVTEKATTTFFAILLRHLGAEGADRLFSEWKGMSASERASLVKLAGEEERLLRPSRRALLAALLDPSMDVREAALEALERQGAPVGDVDIAVREEELRRDLERLEGWAEETGS